ncbi:MAG: transposase, partial [Halothiobacillaceae bacterium]
ATTNFNSYLSSHVYDNLVPPDDFFRQLNKLVDWHELAFDLHQLARNDRGGRPRYSPVVLFKALFLSFLYDASDRDTQDICTYNLRCKYFLGLPITESAPDYSTLCTFRSEVLERFGQAWLQKIFKTVVSAAVKAGISFGTIHALDATHTMADVNTEKDNERQKQGAEPRDTGAAWGAKGLETKLTAKGERIKVVKYFYGYKTTLLDETDHGLITGLTVDPGNTADIDGGERLVIEELTALERKRIGQLATDKGYGCGVLIGILEKDYGVPTAFNLNRNFLRGKYRDHWLAYLNDPKRMAARKKRYVVERTNGDLKDNHSLGRCRYLGLLKYRLQATMAAIAYNLKHMVTILTGQHFRPA